ncbi:MAG: LamG-like jellyroll fold domain-containing protein, partial [Verrucomicrobiota bacterium]|nr:LamG-like jellyroll fold domain-containing protein [Verrucomicrobiota bacterium]
FNGIYSGYGNDFNAQFNSKQWHSVVFTVTENGGAIYIDGELADTQNWSLGPVNSTSIDPVSIGFRRGEVQRGDEEILVSADEIDIDDIRIYDRALSASEVSALYFSETPQFQIIEGSFTWAEAKADAESRGGRLAILKTNEVFESNFNRASDIYPTNGWSLWIGGEDLDNSGDWKWIDGTLVTDSEVFPENTDFDGNGGLSVGDANALALHYNRFIDDDNSSRGLPYILEIIPPALIAPVLDLETFYESNSDENITIDASPADGYPTTYTYQWSFKAIGSTNYFLIPANFGGTAANYQIAGDTANDGAWKVEVTNDAGTTEAQFEYRVFADSDGDGLSDGREVFVLGTDPLNEDTDDDGLLDGVESNTGIWDSTTDTGTDPNNIDSDGDTLLDDVETNSGTFVGLSDTGTNPNSTDSDADGFSDDFEVNTGYDPTSSADTPDSLIVIRTAVELDIYTAIGGVYRIEYTDAIESDVWITAEEGIIGNGDIIRRLYNTREYSDRFYRAIRTDQ